MDEVIAALRGGPTSAILCNAGAGVELCCTTPANGRCYSRHATGASLLKGESYFDLRRLQSSRQRRAHDCLADPDA